MILKLKNQLVIVLIMLFVNTLYSQTNFEKGAFITNSDKKVECFIKNIDWKNNPTEFKYKLTEESEIKTGTIETVKVFKVYGSSKFIRATVDIDRSSSNVYKLSESRNPIFNKEQLFLRVIIEGEANLFYYEDGNLNRFFYSGKEDKINQLVYKEYLVDATIINENNHYKQQLLNTLKCKDITIKNIETLDYDKDDLANFFEKYNNCIGYDNMVNYEKKNKRDLFNFRAKIGFGLASLSINNVSSSSRDTDFDSEFMYRIGAELEMILPFNNNKWAFIVEPSYQSYSSEKDTEIKVDYSTIEIPFGVRHSFFLNDESKIFVNAFYTFILINDSKSGFGSGSGLEFEKAAGQSIGIGYSHKKLSLECRYELTREVLNQYIYWQSDYNQVALIFGYQLF